MSLTEREKEIALEVWDKIATYDLYGNEVLLKSNREKFANLFLSRIREKQGKSYVKEVPDHCDRIVWKGRYYHLNNMAPDCSELVEALKGMMAIVSDSSGVANYHLNGDVADWDEFEEINAALQALTNHTKRMQSSTNSRGEE